MTATDAPELYEFFVPGPAVPKARARVGRNGGAYTPARTRAWQDEVKWAFKQACPGFEPFPLAVPVLLWIDVTLPATDGYPHGRGDGDNFYKAIADALNGLAYEDDQQIVDQRTIKRQPFDGESCGVRVYLKRWMPFTTFEVKP